MRRTLKNGTSWKVEVVEDSPAAGAVVAVVVVGKPLHHQTFCAILYIYSLVTVCIFRFVFY